MTSTANDVNRFVLTMAGRLSIIILFVVAFPYPAEVIETEATLRETFPRKDALILIPAPDGKVLHGYLECNMSIPGYPMTSDSAEDTESGSGIAIGEGGEGEDGGGVGGGDGGGGGGGGGGGVKGIFNRGGIKFTLFNRKNRKGVQMRKAADLKYVNNTKKFVMVTHGWMSSGEHESCTKIKDNFLKVSNVNVIIMDWGDTANDILYPIVASRTTKIAAYCTAFLNSVLKNTVVRHRDIHLIGHSLGAHVFGFCAGRIRNGRIGRISGLDPAQPGFQSIHLNTTQAKFVFVIHTDGDLLGMWRSIGHVDFYPNCGVAPQPGCERPLFWDFCSHTKGWELFAESIRKPYQAVCSSTTVEMGAGQQIIAAIECSSFTYTKCHSKMVQMGAVTPSEARGSFYLRTD